MNQKPLTINEIGHGFLEICVYRRFIEPDFNEHYVPEVFEDICRQYLIRLNMNGEIDPVIEKISKYYYDDPINHKNGEFDIVTEDEHGYAFYEAKYKELSQNKMIK